MKKRDNDGTKKLEELWRMDDLEILDEAMEAHFIAGSHEALEPRNSKLRKEVSFLCLSRVSWPLTFASVSMSMSFFLNYKPASLFRCDYAIKSMVHRPLTKHESL